MTRAIYSLYIDIPEDELDYQPPHYGSDISKTLHTKIQFKKNYSWLKHMQEKYANALNIEYKLFEYDKKYKDYHLWFTKFYSGFDANYIRRCRMEEKFKFSPSFCHSYENLSENGQYIFDL